MTTQPTQPNATRPAEVTHSKVYWRDLPADAPVQYKDNHYEVDSKLVYWHGHEAQAAHFWLRNVSQHNKEN